VCQVKMMISNDFRNIAANVNETPINSLPNPDKPELKIEDCKLNN